MRTINNFEFEKHEYLEEKKQITKIKVEYLEAVNGSYIIKVQDIYDIENFLDLDDNVIRIKNFNPQLIKHNMLSMDIEFFYFGEIYKDKLNFKGKSKKNKEVVTVYDLNNLYIVIQNRIFEKFNYFILLLSLVFFLLIYYKKFLINLVLAMPVLLFLIWNNYFIIFCLKKILKESIFKEFIKNERDKILDELFYFSKSRLKKVTIAGVNHTYFIFTLVSTFIINIMTVYINLKSTDKIPKDIHIIEALKNKNTPLNEYLAYFIFIFLIVFIPIVFHYLYVSNNFNGRYKNLMKISNDFIDNYDKKYCKNNFFYKILFFNYFYENYIVQLSTIK